MASTCTAHVPVVVIFYPHTQVPSIQSKECQKADGPLHTIKCRNNQDIQRPLATDPQGAQECDALTRWTYFHRPVLQYLSAQALGVFEDPSKGAHALFLVRVQPRPQETNAQTKFEITQAAPAPFASFKQILPQIEQAYEAARAPHSLRDQGTYMLMISRQGPAMPHMVPIGFPLGSGPLVYQDPAAVVDVINRGKVC